ncbi:hypothetical protein AJ78_07937 [Emergomyces pasteurianus Ep9510]|uniref:Uncharacterized protein n=1 Tax=Emergomyces pasteurianus Ep9510 TaxID=1447872 RepID=A0A1J9Q7W4_9EURO|nr:hypothetical protein AJ78_07937 [Emergomyces pasteurianus Ep9510]
MSPITMKRWPLVTTFLILLFGFVASAVTNNAADLIAMTTIERRAENLEVRAPKGGKGGGGGGKGGDDDEDDEDPPSNQDFQTCPNGGTTCSECFGIGYVSCITPSNVCYNPSTESRSRACTTQGGNSGATQLAGSLGLGALGLAVAFL